jgi:superfamily II DNA or RNA helicase
MTAKILYQPYWSQVVNADQALIDKLRSELCVPVDPRKKHFAQQASPVFRQKNETKPLVNKAGKFPSGLIADAYKIVKEYQGSCEVERQFEYPKHDEEGGVFRVSKMPFMLRPYQYDALERAIGEGRGILRLATGAGKGVVLAALAAFYYVPTLIVVDSLTLCYELKDEIEQYTGLRCGIVQGQTFQPDTITIAMVQTIQGKVKKKSPKKTKDPFVQWFKSIQMLIIDECHHAKADSYLAVLQASPATIRFGLTATAIGSVFKFNGKVVDTSIEIKAAIGPVIFNMGTKTLVEQGWLSKPTIHMIQNHTEFDLSEVVDFNSEFEKIIVNDEARNLLAAKLILQKWREGKTIIVFTTRLAHAPKLQEKLLDLGIPRDQIITVTGENPKDQRKEFFASYREGKTKILIGTVLNEGLNFQCQVGVNLAGGFTPKTTIQRLGRVLRKPRGKSGDVDTTTVNEVEFYDFTDGGPIVTQKNGKVKQRAGHPFFWRHSQQRIQTYLEEGHDLTYIPEDQFKDIL